jgi:hypothetical protein
MTSREWKVNRKSVKCFKYNFYVIPIYMLSDLPDLSDRFLPAARFHVANPFHR